MMGTKPQTIGYAVNDSPAGLAAWMLGHPGFSRWTWSNSDPEKTVDEVLDEITLYWLTDTATSAGRIYWEFGGGASPAFSAPQKTTEVKLPVAITVFPGESYHAPESWAKRAYPNLSYFHKVDKGGHFAAWEQPALFSDELRAAFRPLRQAI
jgi:pimeloyl-ACP methyl ester carboxylesterase